MTIPNGSNYPESLDTNVNLYLTHDDLKVLLIEDYNPGDTSITVSGSSIEIFPLTGLITLTEQCNDSVNDRAITFFYNSRTNNSFDELEILPGFNNTFKPKNLTNVTLNVMAEHHNSIKDSLIAIQEFVGTKGETDLRPLGDTVEGRLNFLRNLVLQPKAWFTSSKRIGVVPLKIKFTDQSFRSPNKFIWDFGDNTISSISTISVTNSVPNVSNVLVDDLDGGSIEKTYYTPGIYTVKLTVSNEFGENVVEFPDLINARTVAPEEVVISVTPSNNQSITPINQLEEPFLYEHLVPGIINARAGTLIDLTVIDNGATIEDPVAFYTWKLSDDLDHNETNTTKASYSIGGYYDIKVRVDTTFGSYRITTLEDAINVIERENLFLFNYDPLAPESAITKNINSYEFGLISETFKTKSRSSTPVTKDHRFLSNALPDYDRQKREFLKNNGIAQRGTIFSGDNGTSILYWSQGTNFGNPPSSQSIRFLEYEGFTDVWRTPSSFVESRPWNWVSINTPTNVYFLLGGVNTSGSGSPTNQDRLTLEMVGLSTSITTFTGSNYANGADELLQNVGGPPAGNFSVYRSTYKDNNGYISRNDGNGSFFRLKSFYKTEGNLTDGLNLIRKISDIPGNAKLEGQLVSLNNGIYFFNNTGEIAIYSPITNVWAIGGPGSSSPSFRSLQDISVSGYDNAANTLLAASDGDRRAYLSYDYSNNAFIKFTESDLTFSSLPSRPLGEQFLIGVF